MKNLGKKLTLIAIFAISVSAGLALAATSEKSHSLKNGTTAFTMKSLHPKKAILYPESRDVTTSYSTVCLKGSVVSHLSRTFTTSYTRNLLYRIPAKQDVCYFTVSAATKKNVGQIVVQATN
jgi:hypothetical protein